MLKNITVHLEGPICTCEKQNLTWAVHGKGKKSQLIIFCCSCHTSLRVANKDFQGILELDRPYPADDPDYFAKLKKAAKSPPKSNVVPFGPIKRKR